MEWKEFSESPREYPEEVVESAIEGFSKSTRNLLEMIITPRRENFKVRVGKYTDFHFVLYLSSGHVPDYLFEVLTFGYDVELSPIYIKLEESIFEEVNKQKPSYGESITVKDEKEFRQVLDKTFQSQRFNEIVSGLMKIARKNFHAASQK